jgi:hypothetical protein
MKEVAVSQATQDLENACLFQMPLQSRRKRRFPRERRKRRDWSQNEAKVAGLCKPCKGLSMCSRSPVQPDEQTRSALTEIFAADDSEFGRLFSNYLTKPAGPTTKPPATPAVTSGTSGHNPSENMASPTITVHRPELKDKEHRHHERIHR